MPGPESVTAFIQRPGVVCYMLLDRSGTLVDHSMKAPEKTAERIFLSARHLLALGKHQFRHAVFSMSGNRAMILFSAEDLLAAVITDEDSQEFVRALNEAF